MLVVGGALLPPQFELEDVLGVSELRAATAALLAAGPGLAPAPSLCVLQGESALFATGPGQGERQGGGQDQQQQQHDDEARSGWFLGSQDATTCVIAVIHCRQTGAAWAAHLDTPLGGHALRRLAAALSGMRRPRLFCVGGLSDDGDGDGQGPRLAMALLGALHALGGGAPPVELALCCVGAANTAPGGAPRATALAVDLAAGEPRPWSFADRGPEVPRRMLASLYFRQGPVEEVWCPSRRQLVFRAFDPHLSSWDLLRAEALLGAGDEELREAVSTSPEHEPAHFCEDVRAKLRFLLEAQEPGSAAAEAAGAASQYHWAAAGRRWERAPGDGAGAGGAQRPPHTLAPAVW